MDKANRRPTAFGALASVCGTTTTRTSSSSEGMMDLVRHILLHSFNERSGLLVLVRGENNKQSVVLLASSRCLYR